MERMKRYYDSSIRPVSYAEAEKVLVYNPRKQRGKFAKWQVCWHGPVTVQCKLNDSHYVLCKGEGKAVVVHVDRMRKLPNSLDLNRLIRTRTLSTMNPLFHRTSGVGQPATDELPSIHPTDTRVVRTGHVRVRIRRFKSSWWLFSSHYYTKDFETRTLSSNMSQHTTARPHASRSQAHYEILAGRYFFIPTPWPNATRWLVGASDWLS